MSELKLHNIRKSYADLEVIHGIDLEIADGEFVVFVGPSGCGKSTLLRMIAGLEECTQGQIHIGGNDVTNVEPSERGIAMVFQSYALYPHMTVRENIGFGLSLAKTPKTEIKTRVEEAATTLQLTDYLDRKPRALSGGQRQRVAIGRAIVRNPDVFLFDEPLSNLDAALRAKMRLELTDLHKKLDATMIYVTHDQVEAMTMADRIVVLKDGVIEQVGTPMELYNNPATPFVAGFIGSPQMNLFDGNSGNGLKKGLHGVRPEHLNIVKDNSGWQGKITHIERLGANAILYLNTENVGQLIVSVAGDEDVSIGQTISVSAQTEKMSFFAT